MYLKSFKEVLPLLMEYNFRNRTPFFGFGAKIPPFLVYRASDCFSLVGNIYDPDIDSLVKIKNSYLSLIKKIKFHGPTFISPILKLYQNMIKYDQLNQKFVLNSIKYYILAIMTDGKIDDLEETINEIVESSYLPLSLIIIGLGEDPFAYLKPILGSSKLYSKSKNLVQDRNNIIFVQNKLGIDENVIRTRALKNIPAQIETYMAKHKIKPQMINLNKKSKGMYKSFFQDLKDQMKLSLMKLNLYNPSHVILNQIDELLKIGIAENQIEFAKKILS